MDKLRVFISSTMEELRSEREELITALNSQLFWEAVNAEAFPARTQSPESVCFDELEKCHIFVGIYKEKYGFIPKDNNPSNKSIVELEYLKAKALNLPILLRLPKN